MLVVYRLLLVVLLQQATVVHAQQDSVLTKTLASAVSIDQRAAGLPPEGTTLDDPSWQTFKDSVFNVNYQLARTIFEANGFPGYDKVGMAGAKNFWLLVQHCDPWPDFQEQVLKAMAGQVARKNASAQDLAYLTDRVRLNTGRPQVYGTQLTYDTNACQAMPKNLEAASTVNQRRQQVGLDRIESYLDTMSQMHFQMNQASYEKRGIRAPTLYGSKTFGQ
jgi:hypothetical protein